MRESKIEKYLCRRVKELGGECRKVSWIGRRGAPDRFCMFPDRPAVWVELKAEGKKAKPHQAREHARMWAMGQAVVVLDSIDAIDRWIEG